MKNKLILIVIICSLVIPTVVQASDYPVEVTDDLDKEITIQQQPTRIISLAPSHTETLFALGVDNNLIGVTQQANYPAEAEEIEKVGSIKEPNLEKMIALQPDLVLAAGITPKGVVRKLRNLDIKVIGLNSQSIEGIIDDIALIAKATGVDKKGRAITTQMRNKLYQIKKIVKENVESNERPKVFYEIWNDPLYTAGSNTFINDLIALAGGVNIAGDAKGKWPQYNLETLLAENPDVYITSNHNQDKKTTKSSIKNRDKFQEITAIKQRRILVLNSDLVNRASPRIIIGLEKIAEVIHPDLFK
ncbi:ABC transporter substrate-binding protein [Halanaerobacter jeridensis]|uniref:Iron complex transport system substrate-binding protein n=1 Tax=Halanaerobacter jeridensis TaxID=706427 RepID=A0A938XSR4_9FIRM|nr:cobalamin-binding protein [Halanaerobacter jeridensis]MBM7557144.1 iron complex transport system substrate-binding protein [Halanaerobacter jeridensis]